MSALCSIDSDEMLIAMWLHGRPASTQAEYQRDIAKFRSIVVKPLPATTLADLQHYQSTLIDANLKPATLKRKLNCVKSLYSFAASLNYISFNIAAALRLPKGKAIAAHRFLKPDEVKRLIAAAPASKARSLILFLYGTGTRISEACSLRWGDIWVQGFDSAQPKGGQIQATITGKGDKTRVVLIPASVYQALQLLAPHPLEPTALVFNLDRYQAWAIVKQAAKEAGLPQVSPHWFRHAHAIHALKGGAPLELVRDSLGHASVSTTDCYLQAAPDDGSSNYLSF